jgi:hypothetical protein
MNIVTIGFSQKYFILFEVTLTTAPAIHLQMVKNSWEIILFVMLNLILSL